jgi:L-ascorbate metabolism protein UlaG (beta-lactamase superfamily)
LSHYTLHPDPGIKYVLHGWAEDEKPARIDVTYKDVRVRNVPTNIRTFDGGTERHGNSIFIFEAANLCIAHLGHLHHTLTQQQLNEIGKIDAVMVPVDGNYTLDLEGMMEVLKSLKAPLMIPMHYFSSDTLERFLSGTCSSPRGRPSSFPKRRCRRNRPCWFCPDIEIRQANALRSGRFLCANHTRCCI